MKRKIKILMSSAFLMAAFFVASQSFAAIVGTNGSFENGTNPSVYSTLLIGDSTSITDWTVDSGNVDYIGTYWAASDGSRSIDLNGNTAGSVKQVFSTTPGATYKVTFDLSGNPAGDLGVKTVRVSGSGGTPTFTDFTYDTATKANTLADMKWENKTYTFVASTASTTLTFASQTAGAYGPAIDNVKIEETLPAPTTHTITASSDANGTISPTGAVSVNDGDDKTFTITANSGYMIDDVKVDNVSVGAVSTYTFNDVNANHTISVTFKTSTTPGSEKPENKEACKNGGWMNFTNPSFKNQGQCVAYVNHQ